MYIKKSGGKSIKIEVHPSLNISTFNISFYRDLLNCELEEIVEELKDIGVVQVQRLKNKKMEY